LSQVLEVPQDAYYYYTTPGSDRDYLFQLAERSRLHYTTLILYLGKPGKGKSWAALKTCEKMDPNFSIDDVVFNGRQFRKAVERPGFAWLLWDEPNRGLSHREWYTEINKAVTTYLQTSRFREKNVVFALPKEDWIDKSARGVMAGEAIFWHRGIASVHVLMPNYFGSSPETFKPFIGEIEFKAPSHDLVRGYEDKREEWHKKEFPDEPFSEDTPAFSEPKIDKRGMSWLKVYALVKATPQDYTDTQKGRLTSLMIQSKTGCSDQTARKVIQKIALEEITT
jgi:hypothetical protein